MRARADGLSVYASHGWFAKGRHCAQLDAWTGNELMFKIIKIDVRMMPFIVNSGLAKSQNFVQPG